MTNSVPSAVVLFLVLVSVNEMYALKTEGMRQHIRDFHVFKLNLCTSSLLAELRPQKHGENLC